MLIHQFNLPKWICQQQKKREKERQYIEEANKIQGNIHSEVLESVDTMQYRESKK